MGLWAAEKLGKTDDEAKAYPLEVIEADFEEAGDEDVFRKIRSDFDKAGVQQSDHQIRRTMDELLQQAKSNRFVRLRRLARLFDGTKQGGGIMTDRMLASRLKAGETLFTSWSSLPDPLVAEVLASFDLDAVPRWTCSMAAIIEDSVLRAVGPILAAGKSAIVPHPGRPL